MSQLTSRFFLNDVLEEYVLPEELVGGLVGLGTLNFIFGPSGSGKSAIAALLASSFKNSQVKFFGRETPLAQVIYVAGEDVDGVKQRMLALEQRHSKSAGLDMIILAARGTFLSPENFSSTIDVLQREFFDLADKLDLSHVRDVKKLPRVIILDTLAALSVGLDENSNQHTSILIENLKRLAEELNSTVFIIHHTGKDNSKGMRGHSGLQAAADNAFLVSNVQGKGTISWVKAKNYASGQQMHFRLSPEPMEFASNRGTKKKTVVFAEERSADVVFTNHQQIILDEVESFQKATGAPIAVSQLKDRVMSDLGYEEVSDGLRKKLDRELAKLTELGAIILDNRTVSIAPEEVSKNGQNTESPNWTDTDTPL